MRVGTRESWNVMSQVRVVSVHFYRHAMSRVPGPHHTRGYYQLVLDDVRTLKYITFVVIPETCLMLYHIIIIIISNLSNDRSKASSKMIPPHSAI